MRLPLFCKIDMQLDIEKLSCRPSRRGLSILFVVFLIMLGGCSTSKTTTTGNNNTSTPSTTTHTVDGPPPAALRKDYPYIPLEVKDEPRTMAGNKSPYVIFNKTYYVLPESTGFQQTGIASWYGRKFHGRKTSNGERFDMYAMSAAHTSLPIPTYVEVTNLDNNRSMIVRINDRGPFHGNRVIDLSWAAANYLGYAEQGTANVSIRALDPIKKSAGSSSTAANHSVAASNIEPESANTNVASSSALPNTLPPFSYLQVALLSERSKAIQLAEAMTELTERPVETRQKNGRYAIWIGPLKTRKELNKLNKKLVSANYESGFLVRAPSP